MTFFAQSFIQKHCSYLLKYPVMKNKRDRLDWLFIINKSKQKSYNQNVNNFIIDFFRREALEAAISEKDAHLALLEMSGIRSARQADEMDRLRIDRRRLVDRLKQEVC